MRVQARCWDHARWDLALRLAAWHRLSPVLYSHLAEREQAPPEVLSVLEQAYVANSARNLFVSASLQRVLEALSAATVPAMLLKGAALIESVYPDPALREMLDLDILVPADKLDTRTTPSPRSGMSPHPRSMPTATRGRGCARTIITIRGW